jgi:hypothetical protein
VEFTTRFIFVPSLFLAASPLTTVLHIVVSQPRLRRLLAFIQRHTFPVD